MSTPMAMAKVLKPQAEQIADHNYYRQSLISLLYDIDQDYRTFFKCKSVLVERLNDKGGLDTGCITKTDILWISTGMGPKKRLSSAYVCPQNLNKELIKEIIGLSYENTLLENGGMQYRMGRTDGWFRDFENIFVIRTLDQDTLSCWSLLRR